MNIFLKSFMSDPSTIIIDQRRQRISSRTLAFLYTHNFVRKRGIKYKAGTIFNTAKIVGEVVFICKRCNLQLLVGIKNKEKAICVNTLSCGYVNFVNSKK